jgi:hypothetical protein
MASEHTGERTRVLADGTADAAARPRGLADARRAGMRRRGPLGARARLPPHRHGPGLRQRGERRAGAARQRRAARGGLHHDEVLPAQQGPGRRSRAEPASASASSRSTCTSSTGPRAGRPGPGRDGGGAASVATPARSASRTFDAGELDELLAAANRPAVNQVQFSAFEYRRGLLEACEQRGDRARGYSSLGTGRHLRDRDGAEIAQRIGRSEAQVLLRPGRASTKAGTGRGRGGSRW